MSRHMLPEGSFTAADFRDRLDNGRKVAIQILEFFDRHGFTIRRQDLRRINPARIEFFAPKAAQADKRRSPAPGGATGLQIRVGPSDGLRWVRLPSSSAKSSRGNLMMPAAIELAGEVLVFTPKRIGRDFEAQRSFAIIECGKWVGAARAAFAGVVVAANDELERRPKLLNEDAFGKGWMLIVRTQDAGWHDALVTGPAVGPAFADWIAAEAYKRPGRAALAP